MSTARNLAVAGGIAATLLISACSDRRSDTGLPTAPKLVRDGQGAIVMGTCTTINDLNSLATVLFGSGGPNVSSVLG